MEEEGTGYEDLGTFVEGDAFTLETALVAEAREFFGEEEDERDGGLRGGGEHVDKVAVVLLLDTRLLIR